jgi:hypothetical protein
MTNCYKSVFERAYDEFVIILFGESVLSLNTKELNQKLKDGKRRMVIDVRHNELWRKKRDCLCLCHR